MVEQEKTVTFADGTERTVVYDSKTGETHIRKTDDKLTEEALGYNDDSFKDLNDNVVGRSKSVTPEALQAYAERTDEAYSTVHLSANYLRDAAERIELDCCDGLSAVTLHVVNNAPMLLTSPKSEYDYVVAPRVVPESRGETDE